MDTTKTHPDTAPKGSLYQTGQTKQLCHKLNGFKRFQLYKNIKVYLKGADKKEGQIVTGQGAMLLN